MSSTSRTPIDRRVVFISGVAVALAFAAGFIAQALLRMIAFFTNLAFYHRFSLEFAPPSGAPGWGAWVIVVPVIGGVVVGLMARYGSKAIRGHGIPEAMEQILVNESRIPARLTWLKPLSAAISIGTGGPFGAEGPIIATGSALGSVVGQLLPTSADERKTLLAAGAAAGMTATFGSPVSAVLLAVELLLFEWRPRSLIPVTLAAATAAAVRISLVGLAPVFHMPPIETFHGSALAFYVVLGFVVGLLSVGVTRVVYWIEDGFEKLPIHWMFWPAIGGVAVGVVGYFWPRTMGVGYDNIDAMISSAWPLSFTAGFCVMKFISWSISLGSGTSGGTLAPLFTIGGGAGLLLGSASAAIFPGMGVDPRIAALVGMAAIFSGASRAFLASVVFAFETTQQPFGLLPLLGGCAAAYLASCLTMENTIMTEKIARRGVAVPFQYAADLLEHLRVGGFATRTVKTIPADLPVARVLEEWQTASARWPHHGFPVVDASERLVGVVTRKDFFPVETQGSPPWSETLIVRDLIRRQPVVVHEGTSLREAADLMSRESIGRLPVVDGRDPGRLVGILTRTDLLAASRPPARRT